MVPPMRVCLSIEGQEGVTWQEHVALAEACEEHGFEALFRSDHYASVFGATDRGSLNAWAVLAALAHATSTLRLGTLVSPVTFRHPTELASLAMTVDHISGGRVELGIGAGWWRPDHQAHGFEYPGHTVRSEMLAEQMELIHRLWTEESTTFAGRHYELESCAALPKPLQNPRPPIMVGGIALPNTLEPAARYADEYNSPAAPIGELRDRRERVAAACEAARRDPSELVFSVAFPCVVGETEREVREREERVLARVERTDELAWFCAARDEAWLVGTPAEIVERLGALEEIGVGRVYLQHHSHTDLDAVALLGSAVLPAVS
jgi:F420-dependent oxidoreductase-like protein